ncbi:PIF1-like helicase [Hirsutella rhossiliensis]
MPRFNEWQTAPKVARMALSRQLLRDNAHIAAYHFHKRHTLFRTIVLKQKFNLTDSWGRYEWQGRGSSHHHGLYWLSGHLDLDPDNDQSQHPLTVQLLSMVLNRVQRHRCNNYCMQLNKHTKQEGHSRSLRLVCCGQITIVHSPIVGCTTVIVMTITVSQKTLHYSPKMINTRLCLWRKNLMTKTGFASPPFYLGTPLPRKILTFLAAATSTSITTGHGIHPMANDMEVLGPY